MRYAMVLIAATSIAVAGIITGCATTDQMAPPVGPALQAAGEARGHDLAAMNRGRRLYLQDCTTCHAPEPIARYSFEQWQITLDEMSDESNLSASERGDLAAYVLTAHQWLLEQNPAHEGTSPLP